jgi:hypothetical protein
VETAYFDNKKGIKPLKSMIKGTVSREAKKKTEESSFTLTTFLDFSSVTLRSFLFSPPFSILKSGKCITQ